ncbi:MAG: hypothetical protein AAF701_07905, partial [Pseudomonadota bacterium]
GVGALLVTIDALFFNRVFRKPLQSLIWLVGAVVAYLTFSELFTAKFNDTPVGTVTTGLPYPFLNNLEFAQRLEFYATNVGVALVLLGVFTALAWALRAMFKWS